MGYCYHELVPAAILLDHPGITKQEFIDRLNQTHVSKYAEFNEDDSWNSFDRERDDVFHKGSESLAAVLKLGVSEQFKQFQTATLDNNDLEIKPPSLQLKIEQDYKTYKMHIFSEVTRHLSNNVGLPTRVKISGINIKEGDILPVGYYFDLPDNVDEAKVLAVLKEKETKRERGKSRLSNYEVEVLPITREEEVKSYDSDEELFRDYPQYNPDFMYDWGQERGRFRVSHGYGNFLWLNMKGQYTLDPETFDLIPANFSDRWDSYGYGDLILTAEAIKHQTWKLLSRRGLKHMRAFLSDFPESRDRYEQAVFDSHLSLSQKRQGGTITDLFYTKLTPIR